MKIGYATIQGYTHRTLEYNNQDFVLITEADNCKIGLIADGCGSGSNSEVGAQLGLKFLSKRILGQIDTDWKSNLKEDIQSYSKEIAAIHSNDPEGFIRDFLLYTIIGFVEKDDILTIFSYGDGVIIIDDKIEIIDHDNRPKYINNELIGSEGGDFLFREINFENQKITLGSDGLIDLLEGMEKGLVEEYHSLEHFMNDAENFTNPTHLPKLLKKYSRKGIIKDDCTLIMIKK